MADPCGRPPRLCVGSSACLWQGRWRLRRSEQFQSATVGTTVVNISSPGSNSGWTAGAGVEYAFWGTWSVRAEYDFVRLNAVSYTLPGSAPVPFANDIISSNNRQINIFTVGLNYKFGGW